MIAFSFIGMIMSFFAIIVGAVLMYWGGFDLARIAQGYDHPVFMSEGVFWQGLGLIVLILGILAFCYFGIKRCESDKISLLFKERKNSRKSNAAEKTENTEN